MRYMLLVIAFIKNIYIKHVLNTVNNIISRSNNIKYPINIDYSNNIVSRSNIPNDFNVFLNK